MKTILKLLIFFPFFAHSHTLIHAIPKCGIHFIQKTIEEMTGQECLPRGRVSGEMISRSQADDTIICFHGPYSPSQLKIMKRHEARLISMIRDPRDALVSLVFHLRHFEGKGSLRDFLYVVPNFDELTFDEQLMSVMTHPDPRYNYIELYKNRVKWRTYPNACRVRYERLVGSKGGGDDLLQLVEVVNICRYLGKDVDVDECIEIAGKIYKQHGDEEAEGKVFHHAQIGSWKQFFNDEHKAVAKKHLGQLLINLGYEKNLDW